MTHALHLAHLLLLHLLNLLKTSLFLSLQVHGNSVFASFTFLTSGLNLIQDLLTALLFFNDSLLNFSLVHSVVLTLLLEKLLQS